MLSLLMTNPTDAIIITICWVMIEGRMARKPRQQPHRKACDYCAAVASALDLCRLGFSHIGKYVLL